MLPVRALATAASSKVTIWHPRARLKTSQIEYLQELSELQLSDIYTELTKHKYIKILKER